MLKKIHFFIKHNKIKEKIKILNDFLILLVCFLFVLMVLFKIQIFKTNQELIDYDDKTIKLKKQEQQLQIQYLVLTSPARLNALYNELKNDYFYNSSVLTKQQIKTIDSLNDYMFANYYKKNLKKSFAQK